jgi:hypothetical protein
MWNVIEPGIGGDLEGLGRECFVTVSWVSPTLHCDRPRVFFNSAYSCHFTWHNTAITCASHWLKEEKICTSRASWLFIFLALQPIVVVFSQPDRGLKSPRVWGFLLTHKDAPQSVGFLSTSDQSFAETSTWQHTTLTTDKHPCPRLDSLG